MKNIRKISKVRFLSLALGMMAGILCGTIHTPAHAAALHHLDGAHISILWGLPFVGILLSIALLPLFAPSFWHHHYGKVAVFWILVIGVPFVFNFGFQITLYEFLHLMLLDYIPFIVLLFSLFVAAGGIHIQIKREASPFVNTGILLIGSFLASLIGTTGAAMTLIRPIIAINAHRKYQAHIIIFFIFTVANIGGSLTPVGDPPLFLGFLRGVPFFWPTTNLFLPMILAISILLSCFFILDSYLHRRESSSNNSTVDHTDSPAIASDAKPVVITGFVNIFLLLLIVTTVVVSGILPPFFSIDVYGVPFDSSNIFRNIVLLLLAGVSLWATPRTIREQNVFSWEPIREVAKLFFGIFITIVPVIAILKAGSEGSLSTIIELTTKANGEPNNILYFWITGMLSGFLDNAPTYLIFFNAAGGNHAILTTSLSHTLMAISLGAVFMGANTYIGNAPNLMVKAIAESRGVAMPSFFGYIVWAMVFLLPVYFIITYLFFILND